MNKNTYSTLGNTWTNNKENFYVSYAVRGPIVVPNMGLRQDLPVNHPISGPVKEPSPLNNRCCIYNNKYKDLDEYING